MPKPPEEDVFILPDEYKFIPRNKRAILMKNQHNQKLNVEMLVVVDRKMMDSHGHENITTYVLTVLNMVRKVGERIICYSFYLWCGFSTAFYDTVFLFYTKYHNLNTISKYHIFTVILCPVTDTLSSYDFYLFYCTMVSVHIC